MTQPRVAAFARLANGNVNPERVITGQGSMLGRTIHGLYYDAQHDEIVVPNALADSILVYRGGADGAEKPIRVIQGCNTQLVTPHSVSFDPVNREMWVTSLNGHRIVVFPWDANGNARPLRVIKGDKTQLGHIVGIAVDPVRNLMAVANSEQILVFHRTDNGNVAPLARIEGPHTGIGDEPWGMAFFNGRIYVAASNHLHINVYSGVTLKKGFTKTPEDPWLNPDLGFIGVWEITDKGDVAPRMKLGGPFTGMYHPTGLAINPKDGEIYVSDSIRNGFLSFLVPEWFKSESARR